MPRWLYFLLVTTIFAPAIALVGGQRQELAIFICSAISLIPLAALIGFATEDLSTHIGPIAGGLLNATFGNAPEIIIGIFALQQGLISVVKASITGSIISNMLLVFGSSLAIGGWRWGKQYFSARDAGKYTAMMVLVLAAFAIPTTATLVIQDAGRIQSISILIAVILLLIYGLYLATHIFNVHSTRRSPGQQRKLTTPLPPLPAPGEAGDESLTEAEASDDKADPVVPGTRTANPWLSALLLLIATVATAWNSELLVGTIRPVTVQLGWSPVFIGLVIIPIVGNAAEHSSALYIAFRDRVELSMAIALGSSIQVAALVAPLLVLLSLFFPASLNLVFQPLELLVLGLGTILFTFISQDGESSWLEGVQLVTLYTLACVVFFFVPG
jgi:Ca2+:H+ antiporter